MSKDFFEELFEKYPKVINEMNKTFTSHDFILALAHKNQTAYIEALYANRDKRRSGKRTPFLIVHARLAQELANYPKLIRRVGTVNSKDIFGQPNTSVQWEKVDEH